MKAGCCEIGWLGDGHHKQAMVEGRELWGWEMCGGVANKHTHIHIHSGDRQRKPAEESDSYGRVGQSECILVTIDEYQ